MRSILLKLLNELDIIHILSSKHHTYINMPNYKDIRASYISPERAVKYKNFLETDPWARFVAGREQKAVARELGRYQWGPTDRLLDIPCGTGILGNILQNFPFQIVASDYSMEMMSLARSAYPKDRFLNFVNADITDTPFPHQAFACVIALSFLHLVPLEIKRAALKELYALSSQVVIITCSVDTPWQRIKQTISPFIRRRYNPARCPAPLKEIISECESHGFRVVRSIMIVPLLSAHALLVLEK
jgi:ubiquinone/menaquinone biosynthesis C-methylase UbiE